MSNKEETVTISKEELDNLLETSRLLQLIEDKVKEEGVYISKTEYHRLLDVDRFNNALYAAGVDNWDGYGYAQELLEEWGNE
jgi:hypothetical protein